MNLPKHSTPRLCRTLGDLLGRVGALLLLSCLASGCGPEPPGETPVLRIGTYSDPLSLDPHFKNEVQTFNSLSHVYEALTRIDARGRVQPALAERWENPDLVRWHFVLRQDVTFHDGRTLTAEDVVASILRAHHHPRTGMSSYVVEISDVRALDAHTVEIVTQRPYPILLNKLAFVFIVPADAPDEITEPMGTGPYRFVSGAAGRTVYRANDSWWRGRAAFGDVVWLAVPDPAERLRRHLAGELDVMMEVDPADARSVDDAECCRLVSASGLQMEYLAMRPSAEPFDDPRVREAVDLALDRRALVDEVLRGHGSAEVQMAGKQVFGYDPDLPKPRRDLERARRLLAEAGHAEGLRLVLEGRYGRNLEPVAAQIRQAGVDVEVRHGSWDDVYQRLHSGEVTFYMGGMLAVSADASDIFDSVAHTRDPDSGYGQNNSMGYSNPQLDEMLARSSTALDMLERRAMLQQAMGLLVADRVYLGLYAVHELYGLRRGLRWTPRSDGFFFAWEVEPETAAREAE